MDRLKSFDWPGNVRQLENVLERVTAFADGSEISPSDLPAELGEGASGAPGAESLAGVPLLEIERVAVTQTLELCKGNKAEAARRLGVSEKTIYNKLKRHGLSYPHFSSLVVARRRKRRPGKACDRGRRSRTLTVRRGGRPSETQPGRVIAATQ